MPKSREIHLVARPDGMPTPDQFALVETNVSDAADGEVLVQNLYMSVDPAMRPRLTAGQDLNVAMMGGAMCPPCCQSCKHTGITTSVRSSI